MSTVILSVFPYSTVWAHVVHIGDENPDWRGSWLGWSAIEDHFATWTVAAVHDTGVARQYEPMAADFPDRETAEEYCLALVEAHTPVTHRSAAA